MKFPEVLWIRKRTVQILGNHLKFALSSTKSPPENFLYPWRFLICKTTLVHMYYSNMTLYMYIAKRLYMSTAFRKASKSLPKVHYLVFALPLQSWAAEKGCSWTDGSLSLFWPFSSICYMYVGGEACNHACRVMLHSVKHVRCASPTRLLARWLCNVWLATCIPVYLIKIVVMLELKPSSSCGTRGYHEYWVKWA